MEKHIKHNNKTFTIKVLFESVQKGPPKQFMVYSIQVYCEYELLEEVNTVQIFELKRHVKSLEEAIKQNKFRTMADHECDVLKDLGFVDAFIPMSKSD